jgi:hypothetical protein
MVMTEREQREYWGRTHRKKPSPEEARAARWVERDGRWQTPQYWAARDRLTDLGYLEVLPDHYVRGSIRTEARSLPHETIPDFSEYPTH